MLWLVVVGCDDFKDLSISSGNHWRKSSRHVELLSSGPIFEEGEGAKSETFRSKGGKFGGPVHSQSLTNLARTWYFQ